MADQMKELSKYLLMGGVGLTVFAPFLTSMLGDLTWAIATAGAIAGLAVKPSTNFYLAVIAAVTLSVGAAISIPAVGSVLQVILKNMGVLFGAVLIVPIIKTVLKQFKIKAI